jgi:beta-galactosidase beta subunit
MNQSHNDSQSKKIFGNINDLESLLNNPSLSNPLWPTILSWLVGIESEPNEQWITYPDHLEIRALVAKISTDNKSTNDFEVHHLNYDIYLCLKGSELVSSFWVGDISGHDSYDKDNDNLFYKVPPGIKPVHTSMNAGDILVLPPGEAHLPAQTDNSSSVTKIIAKIPSALIGA